MLLVDGKKLADPNSRQRAKNDAITLLRSCLDAGMLNAHSDVDVLITKWDDILAAGDNGASLLFCQHVEDVIKNTFSGRFRELNVSRVAAHPHNNALPLGHGLDTVFSRWLRQTSRASPRKLLLPRPHLIGSEYDRFLWSGAADWIPSEDTQ